MSNNIRFYLLFPVTFFFLITPKVFCQMQNEIPFTHLTTASGLSQSSVTCIAKDKTGFMWFGTQDGLNKFDGYKFKIYRNVSGDSSSLPYNHIKSLLVDKSGKLWVGTLNGGLAAYDERSDAFDTYGGGPIFCLYEDKKRVLWVGTFHELYIMDRRQNKLVLAETHDIKYRAVRNVTITCVFEDRKNNLWIGTKNGLYMSARGSKQIKLFRAGSAKNPGLVNDNITAVLEDKKGRLWVGSSGGINLYDYQKDDFSATSILSSDRVSIGGPVTSLYLNNDNKIWVGKENCLGLFDPDKLTFTAYRTDTQDAQSLNNNSVYSLFLDNQQILWIGTYFGGINKYDKNRAFVRHYKVHNPGTRRININSVTAFADDARGNVWIGTEEGGVFSWDSFTNTFKPMDIRQKGISRAKYTALALHKSRNHETLWIGTYGMGVFQLNLKSGKLQEYSTANGRLTHNAVYSILEDSNGRIWVGTNGGGLNLIHPATGHSEYFINKNNQNSLINNDIRCLAEDEKGQIWIGTYGGISVLNPNSRKFHHFSKYNSGLRQDVIYALFLDSHNTMWAGTMGGGLSRYNRRNKEFKSFFVKNGLSNDIVNSIVEDKNGQLWISTSNGVNRFNRANQTFTTFLYQDGLKTNEFTRGAGYRSASGEIFFGSIDGFNIFSPDKIIVNKFVPPVVITSFQLPDDSRPEQTTKVKLLNSINDGPVRLNYNQSVFTINFAALSYSEPEKNQYACRLEGFDKDWRSLGYERNVTYTNLAPGEYLFRVKAANSDGIWNNNGTTLRIIITPPFWRTNLAYSLYTILILLIIYSIYRELRARQKLKNDLALEKLTSEKMKELNQLKMNFFTNVSHELRTPLSLIIDPLRKITEEEVPANELKSLSNLAFKNSSRLLSLVNQLLDFRKFEGSLKLEPLTVNVTEIIVEVAQAFKERASKRKIEFTTELATTFQTATIDIDKFQKILINLISNAFKFTPDGGKIKLTTLTYCDQNGVRQLEVHVKDSGPGVPKEYKQKIFDIFFQVQHTPRFGMESSGIGLALVRELVQLHNGEIYEKGKDGEGAYFVLKIPAGDEREVGNDVLTSNFEIDFNQFIFHDFTEETREQDTESDLTILLVEDNDELRKYIAGYLSVHYHIEEASTGHEGYRKAVTIIPDLIISDVMMIDGDGLELCEKVKTDEKTCHIPVILLTARQADESKIEGYKSGADAYISKPFNSDLLETRVANLISSRKKLRSQFSGNPEIEAQSRDKLTDLDQDFLKRAGNVVVDNLLHTNFDIDRFAELLKMNRGQLTRKLKAIINQTPQEFLIHTRLKEAIKLIHQENLTISEAAYRVGFSERANFSRSFTKVYGLSPQKYLKENPARAKPDLPLLRVLK
ncbi:MAG: response regulator [Sphingobacteriaceae bacterium]|nr:response regulator [Sphingobacteriaceae bacterium]